jgi:hypothetical protein
MVASNRPKRKFWPGNLYLAKAKPASESKKRSRFQKALDIFKKKRSRDNDRRKRKNLLG